MVTRAPKETPTNVQTAMPSAWGTAPIQEFSGHDLTDKKDLVGTAFLVIGAMIERNENRDYDVAFVYALDINGTEFEFSDSSQNGIRQQVQDALNEQGLDPAPGAGYQALKTRIACMKGLRMSPFEAVNEKTGKTEHRQTFYLSAVGVPRS